jgi:hypothetical protein
MRKQRTQPTEFIFPAKGADIISLIIEKNINFHNVSGDYLKPYGINKGDIIVAHHAETYAEDKPSLWFLSDEKYLVIGFAFDNFGDISICQPDGTVIRYKKRQAQFCGNAVYIIRSLDVLSPFETVEPAAERPSEDELTAVCSECEKTETGSRRFLKAQGWKLKGEQLCVACDLL